MIHRFIDSLSTVLIYTTDDAVYNDGEVICMATENPRFTISVNQDLFRQIEDFRFENRFQTRSEATAELIRLGLQVWKRQKETQNKKEN